MKFLVSLTGLGPQSSPVKDVVSVTVVEAPQ